MSDRKIIDAFRAARLGQQKLLELPEPETPGYGRAFDLQCAITRDMGWRQIGWKIGCTSERAQKALNAPGPFPGTMFAERQFKSGDFVPTVQSNKRIAETEVAFTMAKGLPPRGREYAPDEVLQAVASVHAAIEMGSPRTPNGFDDAVPWFIVDGGLNDAIILGPAVKPLERRQYGVLRASAAWNGRTMTEGNGANAMGGGDLALAWLANHLNGKNLGLKEGDVVTTGMITEFISAAMGDSVEVEFEFLGKAVAFF